MDDDFNTGGAIGELFELVRKLNKYCDDHELEAPSKRSGKVEPFVRGATLLRELANILGIFSQAPTDKRPGDELLAEVMQLVVDLRDEARTNKNFSTADAIRDGMGPLGITLEDRAGGTEWSGGEEAFVGIIQLLIGLRQTARNNKDFATSDTVRDRLADIGVTLEDRAGGTEWSRG